MRSTAVHRSIVRHSVAIMPSTDPHHVQLPRKAAYEAAHQDTQIIYCGTFWQSIRTEPNGMTVITRYELVDLMNQLESK
jgi:hypothetical protein